jgi:NAD(P)-dependent dehydrogenase (short-subunit alcohol dehydrogenase family)
MHAAFEGKVAFVTGAAGGIGLATAKAPCWGASVVVADHNEELLNEAAEKLREEGHQVFDRFININLRGAWNCTKGELREMVAQGRGAIVNCSSIGGIVGSPGRTAYSASKHAIFGLTQSAAFEYVNKGIVINAVCPSKVDAPMTMRMTNNYDPEL